MDSSKIAPRVFQEALEWGKRSMNRKTQVLGSNQDLLTD